MKTNFYQTKNTFQWWRGNGYFTNGPLKKKFLSSPSTHRPLSFDLTWDLQPLDSWLIFLLFNANQVLYLETEHWYFVLVSKTLINLFCLASLIIINSSPLKRKYKRLPLAPSVQLLFQGDKYMAIWGTKSQVFQMKVGFSGYSGVLSCKTYDL